MAAPSRGFTIMETLYASAVFAIGLSGLLSIEIGTASASARLGRLAVAEQILLGKAERFKSLPTTALQALGASQTSQFDAQGRSQTDPLFSSPVYTVTTVLTTTSGTYLSWLDASIQCAWSDSLRTGAGNNHAIGTTVRIVLP